MTSDLAARTFRDRFGSVGRGTVCLRDGLVEPLLVLLRDRAISVAQYEQLFTFLEHDRMGLSRDLYAHDTYRRRAQKVRALGLGRLIEEDSGHEPVEIDIPHSLMRSQPVSDPARRAIDSGQSASYRISAAGRANTLGEAR
jgi:hypothetical protein